jgi:hypothetical protein
VSPTNALSYLNDFRDWLRAVFALVIFGSDVIWQPGVLSRTAGNWNILTDLAVDTKIDTQRRREKSQSAVRQSVAW